LPTHGGKFPPSFSGLSFFTPHEGPFLSKYLKLKSFPLRGGADRGKLFPPPSLMVPLVRRRKSVCRLTLDFSFLRKKKNLFPSFLHHFFFPPLEVDFSLDKRSSPLPKLAGVNSPLFFFLNPPPFPSRGEKRFHRWALFTFPPFGEPTCGIPPPLFKQQKVSPGRLLLIFFFLPFGSFAPLPGVNRGPIFSS